MNTPLVSVIVTSYNRAELLSAAIQSAIDQTYKNIEIIVVDDGSRDHSLEVIEAFRQKYPEKIFCYTHESQSHKGLVPTYQLGISKCRGQYVAFLEQDDHWSENYLAAKTAILQKEPAVGVVFSRYEIDSTGWFGRDMTLRQWLLKPTIKLDQSFDNFENLLQRNNVATFSCFVTRKSLLSSMPLPAEQFLTYDWWILVYLSIDNDFYCDTSSLTYWRWSKQSTMGKQSFEAIRSQSCNFMEYMYFWIAEQKEMLPVSKQVSFTKYQNNFGYFLPFYKRPGVVKFIKFFIQSPVWAVASFLSLVVNRLKFK